MKPTDIGMNRTGAGMSPKHTKELIDAAKSAPMPPGDESQMAALRSSYSKGADAVGTVPPPATMKGAAKTAGQMLKGNQPTVLIDKLGERLAFERTGVRLYDAGIAKLMASGKSGAGGVTVERLTEIREEELEHMLLVAEALEKLGADPTTETPCADVAGVMSLGIVQVLTDPRTTLTQCLDAVLAAELIDNASWEMLIELCRQMGRDDFVPEFERALREEQEHLRTIKTWLANATIGQGTGKPMPA